MAFMDVVVLLVALAEVENVPSVPTKVTLNEYIEIAKYYSTQKKRSVCERNIECNHCAFEESYFFGKKLAEQIDYSLNIFIFAYKLLNRETK